MINLDPQNDFEWLSLANAFEKARASGFSFIRDPQRGHWQQPQLEIQELFSEGMPLKGCDPKDLVDFFDSVLLNYSNGNTHPNFFGWVHGGGNLYGALGEMCAALMNSNLGGRDHIGNQVEHQVLRWFKELFNFPTSSSGLLTSGTSMATLIALAVARQKAAGLETKTLGVQKRSSPLVGYCSSQSHNSVLKAFQLLGLGSNALRSIPVNDDFTINTQALAKHITADKAAGATPFCVIATVGTVNTGAIDDLANIQTICEHEGIWLHIDAAFGGAIALLEEYSETLLGIENADSLAFDFHKWFQVPYSVGGLIIRDSSTHLATFSERKEYLTSQSLGLDAGETWFCDLGPELSRGFLALKVWFTFQGLGRDRIADVVRKHCNLARDMAKKVDEAPNLERLAPAPMNIVCLRYVPLRLAQIKNEQSSYLDALNQAIVTQLQLQGLAAPSTTTLNGQLAIRIAIVNHRTEMVHIINLVDNIQRLGELIDSQFAPILNPTNWHLMQEGDARLIVNPQTGLNRYGCSPSPRENAFTFASSTATSISISAYKAAELYRQQILNDCVQANSLLPLTTYCRALEQDFANTFGLADLSPDIHLSPSGTDAQLHAVSAVVTAQPSEWVSIVCGADETGRGTPFSVTGTHFDTLTCLGHRVTKGECLAGMPNIGFKGIHFHDEKGEIKPLEELDTEIEDAVTAQIAKGRSIMLHAMDQSKLGCWAPSPTLLNKLRNIYGSRLQIIIDACQLRLDSEDMRDHLKKGDILLLTGSKFFTGPPFSGVAIFPHTFTQRLLESGRTLPTGLIDYVPQSQLGRWRALLPNATQPLAIGVYLRWQAALTEAKRYYQVPKTMRISVIDQFSHAVCELLHSTPNLEPLFDQTTPWWSRTEMKGDELSTRRSIFPFYLRHASGKYLSQAEVTFIYEQLNQDCSNHTILSDSEKALARQCCHIGQPVKIDDKQTSVLRISMGARILSDGWHNGAYDSKHLEEELRQVRTTLNKITLCLKKISGVSTFFRT